MYLIALILPPLALALLEKHLEAIVVLGVLGVVFVVFIQVLEVLSSHGVWWAIAMFFAGNIYLAMTYLFIFVFGFILVPWALCVWYAVYVVRQAKADKRSQALIDAIKGRNG